MTQMQESSALGRIVELVRDLRRRCPWDAAQTPQSLRPYLVEEVLELDHALGEDDAAEIRTELGDLLLHLAFQIVLAEERGQFGAEDLTRGVEEKMWRRHPHLFPDKQGGGGQVGQGRQAPKSADQAVGKWEETKRRERAASGKGLLDGLPPTLPPLLMAYRLQERAVAVGFDWPDAQGPLAKVREELGELEREMQSPTPERDRLEAEIGDLLFAAVNLSRKLDCDPRAALEKANKRFTERFRAMEVLAAQRGLDLGAMSLEEMDRLWEEAKGSQG